MATNPQRPMTGIKAVQKNNNTQSIPLSHLIQCPVAFSTPCIKTPNTMSPTAEKTNQHLEAWVCHYPFLRWCHWNDCARTHCLDLPWDAGLFWEEGNNESNQGHLCEDPQTYLALSLKVLFRPSWHKAKSALINSWGYNKCGIYRVL